MANDISPRFQQRLIDRPNPIEQKTPNLSDFVSIENSVIFIAHRVQNENDTLGHAVDKVRKQINYAIKHGKVACKEKTIKFEELIRFVFSKKDWVDKFEDFHTAKANITIPTPTVSGYGSTQPSNFDGCLKVNSELQGKIIELQQKNTELLNEIERLKPYEQKYRKHTEDSRRGGRNGKGIKKHY